jgi:hypothetical protein
MDVTANANGTVYTTHNIIKTFWIVRDSDHMSNSQGASSAARGIAPRALSLADRSFAGHNLRELHEHTYELLFVGFEMDAKV